MQAQVNETAQGRSNQALSILGASLSRLSSLLFILNPNLFLLYKFFVVLLTYTRTHTRPPYTLRCAFAFDPITNVYHGDRDGSVTEV